jgi:serine protease inhibitor
MYKSNLIDPKIQKKNINKLLLERSDMLNGVNTRNIGRNTYKHHDKNYGEITGANLSVDDTERGLPLRDSISIIKRDEALDMTQRFDFDIDEDAKSLDIEYNDPNQDKQKYNFFGEEKEKVDTAEICKNNLNYFCFNLFNLLQHYMKTNYCVSPLLVNLIYVGLYIAEINGNLDEKFSFPEKNIMFDGTSKILTDVKQYIDKSIIFINKDFKLNKEYVDYISDFVNVKRISDPINVGFGEINLHFVPKFGFHKRNTVIKNKIEIMRQLNAIANYYADSNTILLEMINDTDDLGFGILSTKENINVEYFNYITKSLKTYEFKEIHVPKIKHSNKYTFSSIMKRMNMDNIFNTFLINNIMELNDIKQNITFTLEETGNKPHKSTVKNDRKFISPSSFIYYVRNIQTNLILFVGVFNSNI